MKIKRLTKTATLPTRGSEDAAGWDLYADIKRMLVIEPHTTVKVSTGIAIEIPKGNFGGVYARSGLATKRSLAPINKVGVIDSDYRGEIIVALHNYSNVCQSIDPQERIAQLIIQSYTSAELEEVNELSDTERGKDGFGSSGKF